MSERDESRLPRWVQSELRNLRQRAEDAEARLRDAVDPKDERADSGGWQFEVIRGADDLLLRLPVNGMRMQLRSPLGFAFSLTETKPGLMQFNCSGGRRDRIVVIPRSSNLVELGAVPLFGGEIEGES